MNFAVLSPLLNVALLLTAAVIVWFTGSRLARYADAISEQTGIGREFLGMMLLGGVTSLPELAVATTATLQSAPLLSINDVLGSASINIVILAVADMISGRKALTAMQSSPGVMLLGVIGMLERRNRSVFRMGFDSVAVMLAYIAGVVVVLHGLR